MDLIDRLKELASQASKLSGRLETEEATKNALVMPFINALGYNVFDPSQVVPEFTADVGTKRGEKVDYAVMREAKPIILFECKTIGVDLDQAHASQLYRYFSVTAARFGVLTNGVNYRFFSDLEEPNRMDSRPFFELNLADLNESGARELRKFTKEAFDEAEILSRASDLKYTRGIKKALAEEWVNPSDDLVRLFACRVYAGRMTRTARQQFAQITKRAFQEFLSDRVSERLQSALAQESATSADENGREDAEGEIITTEQEHEGFYIVRAIVSEVVDPRRVFMRDRKTYCGILLDDNNRKSICRLWFDGSKKYVGVFDAEKNEERVPVEGVEDIYRLGDRLRETVRRYEGISARPAGGEGVTA